MLKSLALSALLATVSLANGQTPDPAASVGPPPNDAAQQAAPIVRHHPANGPAYPQHLRQRQPLVDTQPIAGVWLRSESTGVVKTIAATSQHTEIRLERGRLNVTVHQPAQHAEILIDLPGGQTSLLKDGLYTFNADTNTVRVLRGEAAAFPGPAAANSNVKPRKIKEDHQLAFADATAGAAAGPAAGAVKPVEAYPYELTADLLPLGGGAGDDRANADGYAGDYPRYATYPYDGYAYPYYASGYGYYPYGYPFGFGYGVGFGYGYYGGFRGGYGGYRGGFRR